jgi:hypothetical protein
MVPVKACDDIHIGGNNHVEYDGNTSDDHPDAKLSCELQPIQFSERVKSGAGRRQGKHINTLRQALVILLTTSGPSSSASA